MFFFFRMGGGPCSPCSPQLPSRSWRIALPMYLGDHWKHVGKDDEGCWQGQPSKTRPFPFKTRVSWVPGRWWQLKLFWNFHPECLGFHDPIWRAYFSNGLVKNHQLVICDTWEMKLVFCFFLTPSVTKRWKKVAKDGWICLWSCCCKIRVESQVSRKKPTMGECWCLKNCFSHIGSDTGTSSQVGDLPKFKIVKTDEFSNGQQ